MRKLIITFLSTLLMLSSNVFAAPYSVLHAALADIDQQTNDVYLIGYQSVEHVRADAYGASKYIVLDFRADKARLADDEAVAKVEFICRKIISNRPLLKDLSELGYDMVSVAFDETSQFDCL
ncbi:phosphoribosylformylglycinamidine synthase subunit PurS [Hahella sp. CCB-MM4]|uniref:phosphoribosylformylglycinamidine synthase subunit PurS n=1 Tax=Hahella sp. (strain CCB-MM4) TaxID=1926491 RepID=UPI0011400713|nr:phosphoribosylformylglycinamidine synthase subunit PurS [Hahella sp. CCB-MM4]